MTQEKPVIYLSSTRKNLEKLPKAVKDEFLHGLQEACRGRSHPSAKPLKGYKGRGVLELINDYRGDTFRGVYTVKLKGVVYVLHVFKKKSTKGIATPKKDKELIDHRLRFAMSHHKEWIKGSLQK
ncbi:MAG: type II toxin-antitoxin system RelE/ParE family toxin [Waddliaceae bacterium]